MQPRLAPSRISYFWYPFRCLRHAWLRWDVLGRWGSEHSRERRVERRRWRRTKDKLHHQAISISMMLAENWETCDEENEFPSLWGHVFREFRHTHGYVWSYDPTPTKWRAMKHRYHRNNTLGSRCTYYQIHWRSGISFLVYQKPVMRVRPLYWVSVEFKKGTPDEMESQIRCTHGVTAASKIPIITKNPRISCAWMTEKLGSYTVQQLLYVSLGASKFPKVENLRALEKLRHWVIIRTVNPHIKQLIASTLWAGKRPMSQPQGYWPKKYPA